MNKTGYTITDSSEKALRYIGETEGNDMELNCRRALAEYALHGTMPEDREIASRIAAMRFEVDRLAEEEERRNAEAAKRNARPRTRKYDYDEITRLRDEGKTLKEIREATGATPPSVYHAMSLRPKMCFNGCTEKTYKAARKKWR